MITVAIAIILIITVAKITIIQKGIVYSWSYK